jgi:hypothetical protein
MSVIQGLGKKHDFNLRADEETHLYCQTDLEEEHESLDEDWREGEVDQLPP